MPRTLLSDRRLVGPFAILFIALTQGGCTSLLGDFQSSGSEDASPGPSPDATTSDGAKDNDSGAAPGTTCTTGTQCATGFCADGVCCNNACSGTCESCNQPGALSGTCSPIAATTDPQMECVMTAPPVIDAGVVDAGSDAGDAAGVEAGDAASIEGGLDASPADAGAADAGDASSDAAGGEAGPSLGYNQPDGGVTTDNTKCAGSCDGKGGNGGGACVYPGSTKDCGTQFCNTSTQKAGFVCDGAGHCSLSLTNCTDYSCSSATNTCGTTCSTQADCLPTDYCDGVNCHPKRGSGIPCANPSECNSGFCDNAVCCDTDCSIAPGGNCNKVAATAGQCTCNNCPNGQPCAVFYKDADGDGYGDPATTSVACAAGPTPTGYVTNNTDCDDGDANVHPGQTAYFSSSSKGKGTYDYNCDGSLSKGIPEYPSYYSDAYCGFCGTPQTTSPACSVSTETCSTMGAQSTLGCSEYSRFIIFDPVLSKAVTTQSSPQLVISNNYYCGPSGTPDPYWDKNDRGSGFAGTVGCGLSGAWIYCGTCSGTTGAPYEYNSTNTQTCH